MDSPLFKVRRSEPELVKPAKATPNDVKSLSDWDDRALLRSWVSAILFYDSTTRSTVRDSHCSEMKVTRLACGGFILAFSFNHVMSDVVGAVQLVTAISELALGAHSPSVMPVWQRELLNARDGPQPRVPTKSDDIVVPNETGKDQIHMTYRSFFFGPKELEAIRARLPQCPKDRFTSFELISACVFHCRAISLEHHAPEEQVRMVFTVNARSKFNSPPLPSGYYGNASFLASITLPIQSFSDLQCVVEEVKKAKEAVTEDYVRSSIQEVMARRSDVTSSLICPSYGISDVSRAGLSDLDFGWGKPRYASTIDDDDIAHFFSFMVAVTNNEGKEGKLITLYMPPYAMDKFDLTLRTLLS